MVDYGQVIRELRRDRRWTVSRLAMKSGITRNTIYVIESTGRGRLDTYEKLLNALGYDFEIVPIDMWHFDK